MSMARQLMAQAFRGAKIQSNGAIGQAVDQASGLDRWTPETGPSAKFIACVKPRIDPSSN
jgi:hypothetical protein